MQTDTMKVMLDVSGLSLAINGKHIIRDVDLSIAQGEILGLIGESGSGKSLTAFSLLQLLPDGSELAGSAKLDGQELLTLDESELCRIRGNDIGMIFQEPMTALNPVQTIGEQVAETVLIHQGISRREALKVARQTLNRVELPAAEFPLERYPHQLSGGQRQRVVIAMAIALKPKLLIADEPTTALDVTTQAQILDVLKRLVAEDSMSLLLITHDLAVVSDTADHIAIMKEGCVVESGETASVLNNMQHPYTKKLFKASAHIPQRDQYESAASEPLCVVENLVRDYVLPRRGLLGKRKYFRAVNKVSFAIHRGESVGLVGESGCGKSTLTRAMLGLEAVQGGSITLNGQSVVSGNNGTVQTSRAVRRQVQVVFQDPYGSFNPRHRVNRLVSEPFHLWDEKLTTADQERAVVEALESVGLAANDRHKFIHEFSGGQRQRIAIARALIIKPALIILDEAVSALDVSIRAQILDLLAELVDEFDLSYLFISHDLSVVRSITDRVLVMKEGEIIESGKTQQVFEAPRHPYTQQLIAAIPQLPQN